MGDGLGDATTAAASNPGSAARTANDGSDRYILLDELGSGGMGVVWSALDCKLDRKVALKLMHDRFLGAGYQERLLHEARAMARLAHPNVVTVFDVGEREQRTFIAMELVRGESVATWLREPRPWRDIVRVFRDAARGLAAAHAAGVVHRDVKPSNILIGDDGRARVADFGIAASGTIGTGDVEGTPAYMAPEQLRGGTVDARTDQFGLCASLHEALSGRRPFDAATHDARLAQIDQGAPALDDQVPRWLAAAVARGLAASPAQRHASMAALEEALREPRTRRVVLAASGGAVVIAAITALAVRSRGGGAEAGADNAATIELARAALAREPAEALAYLARLDPAGPGWDAARVLAADALSRPQLELTLPLADVPRTAQFRSSRGMRELISWNDELVVVDLRTRRAERYTIDDPDPARDIGTQTWFVCRDGRRALRTHEGARLRAHELDLGSRRVTAHRGADAIAAVGGCTDEQRLFRDGERVVVWSSRTARPRALPVGTRRGWTAGNGRHVITVDDAGVITRHDLDGEEATVLGTAPFDSPELGLSADAAVVIVPAKDGVAILRADRPIENVPRRSKAVAAGPDGTWVAFHDADGLWIFRSPGSNAGPLAIRGAVERLVASADGRSLVALGERATLIDTSSLHVTELATAVHAVTPDGALVGFTDGVLRAWRIRPPTAITLPGMSNALSPDGRWLLSVPFDNTAHRIDRHRNTSERIELPGLATGGGFAPDGTVVLFAGPKLWRWRLGEATTSELGASLRDIVHMSFSPSGEPQVIGARSVLRYPRPGEPHTVWKAPRPGVRAIGASRDLRYLVTSDARAKTLELIDTATSTATALAGACAPVTFAPDATRLATTSCAGGLVVWTLPDLTNSAIPFTSGKPTHLAYAREGERVAVASPTSLHVVDLTLHTARALAHDAEIGAMLLDGARLVARHGDHTVLWDLASGERRTLLGSRSYATRLTAGAVEVVSQHAFVSIPDDLPVDPEELSAQLRALPFALVRRDDGTLTVVVVDGGAH